MLLFIVLPRFGAIGGAKNVGFDAVELWAKTGYLVVVVVGRHNEKVGKKGVRT